MTSFLGVTRSGKIPPLIGRVTAPNELSPESPLKILIYTMNFEPELTGVGRYSGELARYLAGAGHQVEVITSPPHYPSWTIAKGIANKYTAETCDGLAVWRCPIRLPAKVVGMARLIVPLSFSLSSIPVLVIRALAFRPHIVLATEPTILAAPATYVVARAIAAAAIIHVQDIEIEAAFAVGHLRGRRKLKVGRKLESLMLRAFDHIITISDSMGLHLRSMGVPEASISVVRNWVDLSKIGPLPLLGNTFRERFECSSDSILLLYAGSIGAKQGLDSIIRAARLLMDDRRFMFAIVGDGPAKAALQLDAPGNVTFLPLQPEDQLSLLLASANVHLLPQVGGTSDLMLPSKLGGILASGRPLIAQAAADSELERFLRGAAVCLTPGDEAELVAVLRLGAFESPLFQKRRLALAEELSAHTNLRRFASVVSTVTRRFWARRKRFK